MTAEDKTHSDHIKALESDVLAVMENDELLDAIVKKLIGKVVDQVNSYVAKWLWQQVLKYIGLALLAVGAWILLKLNVVRV